MSTYTKEYTCVILPAKKNLSKKGEKKNKVSKVHNPLHWNCLLGNINIFIQLSLWKKQELNKETSKMQYLDVYMLQQQWKTFLLAVGCKYTQCWSLFIRLQVVHYI